MSIKYFFILFFLLNNFCADAQINVIKQIDKLNNDADTLCLHKDEKGIDLAVKALTLSHKINYHKGIGEASHSIGLTKFRRDNDSALFYFFQSKYEFQKEYPGFEKYVLVLNNISRTYDELLKFDSSLVWAKSALNFTQNSPENESIKNKWLMYSYGAIANSFAGLSKYDSANFYYMKAIYMAEQIQNTKMLAVYLKAISGIHAQLGNNNEAIQYGLKAIATIKNDDRALTIALASLAAAYIKVSDYNMAEKMADSSIKVGIRCNVGNSIGRNYITLGDSRLKQNKLSQAVDFYKTGLIEGIQNHNSKHTIGLIYLRLGEVYFLMDKIELAKENYLLSLKNTDGDIEITNNINSHLSKLAIKQGDFKEGYLLLKQYTSFRDSIYTKEIVKTIIELNAKYETEKKELQLAALTKDKIIQQLALKKSRDEIIHAALIEKTLHQNIETAKLIAQKQEQQIEIQELNLEKNEIELQKQQADLLKQQAGIQNSNNQLKINQQEKAIQTAIIKNQQTKIYFALLIALITIITGLFFFNRYKLTKKIEHQKAIYSERARLSEELHDEVGATLSGISMYSHLTKEQIKQSNFEEVQKSLNIMQSSSSEMVNKLNDIVWLINPEQDDLQKLLNRLEDYTRNMAAIKNIQSKIKITDTINSKQITIQTRRNIYLFCKEAINNAVKYSKANELQFFAHESGDYLEIAINDDGIGFDKNKIKPGNGLGNLQKRADELKAVYQFISNSGKGCKITLKVKIT